MKIYSMTATFGKLEHQTLRLEPGLNIIEAPNEWGKSTWSAFLCAMLYGIDTAERNTKTSIADKERYAPWSGSPMSGRIDLNWNGRDITIERSTKGRLILGQFLAYETETGVEVPELNANNCGQMLLGVERSVFRRAGFIRLADMPVTQDDALRRRLNALVTTGDESGAADTLAQQLKDLKNRCRFNRTGLIPQTEAQRDTLETRLQELQDIKLLQENAALQKEAIEQRIEKLENHKTALAWEAVQEHRRKAKQAMKDAADAKATLEALEERCKTLPSPQELEQTISEGQLLQLQWSSLQDTYHALPKPPAPPETPERYLGKTPEEAIAAAEADLSNLEKLEKKRKRWSITYGALCVLIALIGLGLIVTGFLKPELNVLMLAGSGVLILGSGTVMLIGAIKSKRMRKKLDALYALHPGLSPDRWLADAQSYSQLFIDHSRSCAVAAEEKQAWQEHYDQLKEAIKNYAGELTLSSRIATLQNAGSLYDQLEQARKSLRQAEAHAQTLSEILPDVPAPAMEDRMTYSAEDTDRQITAGQMQLQQLQLKLGQCQGRMEALGQESELRARLQQVKQKLSQQEMYYGALEIAQKALAAASTELQRRFAPRIAKRAQELFSKFTGGRYDRLRLAEDLSLFAGASNEDNPRPAAQRSDGTVDQLYLALRLALSEELTPEAPLVLDDALVRFDDQRLKTVLETLQETAQDKQVILFTCQSRESKLSQ